MTDIKTNGAGFSWIKGGGGKLRRLDRILISDNFGEHRPNYEAELETRLFSDHKPFILKQVKRNYGKVPFKFYNSWLEEEECRRLVLQTWENFTIEGQHTKLFIIMQKLKAIKDKVRKWNIERSKKESEVK